MNWKLTRTEAGVWQMHGEDDALIAEGATPLEAVANAREKLASELDILAQAGVPVTGARFEIEFMENEPSVDGRILDANSTNFDRATPLPLMFTKETTNYHEGAMLAGVIDTVGRDGLRVWAQGNFDPGSEDGIECQRLVSEGLLTTWSPDIGNATIEYEVTEVDGEGWPIAGIEHLTAGTFLGGTVVPFPALSSAKIRIFDPTVTPATADAEDTVTLTARIELARARQVKATSALETFQVGDSDEDPAMLAAGVDAALDGVQTALDAGNVEQAQAMLVAAEATIDALLEVMGVADADEPEPAPAPPPSPTPAAQPAAGIAASSAPVPVAPPAAWFENPNLDGPTPLTIDDDGRVYGHLAVWGSCHTAHRDACVTPPHSNTDYAYFRTGRVHTAEGEVVSTGVLTMNTGHAGLTLGHRATAAHYDDTGTGVADLNIGEDTHGVWVAGALRPAVTEEQVRVLRGSSPSGDWRAIGGGLELVAALEVNVPGFPVLAASGAAASSEAGLAVMRALAPRVRMQEGECLALVAAGSAPLAADRMKPYDSQAEWRELVDSRLRALELTTDPLRASAAAALRSRVHGAG